MTPDDYGKQVTRLSILAINAVLLLTTLCIMVPLVPTMPSDGLDPSWVFGINQAVGQGLAFGRDIIFSYGPYAAILTRTYHPATDAMALVGGFHLALCFWWALVVLTEQTDVSGRLMLLVSVAMLGYSGDAALMAVPVAIGTACTATAHLRSAPTASAMQASVMCMPLGLLPLVKGSMLALCSLVLLVLWTSLLHNRQWQVLAGTIAAPLIAAVTYWFASGQALSDLPDYVLTMLPIINDYSAAMSKEGFAHEVILYLTSSAVLLWMTYKCTKKAEWPFLVLIAVSLLILLD